MDNMKKKYFTISNIGVKTVVHLNDTVSDEVYREDFEGFILNISLPEHL